MIGWRPADWEEIYQQAVKKAYEELNTTERPHVGGDVDRVLVEAGAEAMLIALRRLPRERLEEWTGFVEAIGTDLNGKPLIQRSE